MSDRMSLTEVRGKMSELVRGGRIIDVTVNGRVVAALYPAALDPLIAAGRAVQDGLDPDGRSIIRQLSNALMWCDTRYRQTLEGKPVRDVGELRHEVVAALDAAGRYLDRNGSAPPSKPVIGEVGEK